MPGSRATGVLRAAFHPLQLVGPAPPPWADFGLGYRSEWVLDWSESPLHCPYAELGLYPVRSRLTSQTRLRFGAYTSADALLTAAREPGLGATLGSLLEVTGFSSGSFGHSDEDGAVAGASHGQWAVGLFASTSLRNADDRFSQTLTTGMSFRIPLVFGVACCIWSRGETESRSAGSSQAKSSGKGWQQKRHAPEKRREYHPARPRRKNQG